MNVKMLGVYKETVVFSVDGKKIEVPREIEMGDPKNVQDITQHFIINQAKNLESNALADSSIQKALVEYISDEFSASKVKYKIVTG